NLVVGLSVALGAERDPEFFPTNDSTPRIVNNSKKGKPFMVIPFSTRLMNLSFFFGEDGNMAFNFGVRTIYKLSDAGANLLTLASRPQNAMREPDAIEERNVSTFKKVDDTNFVNSFF